MTQARQNEPDSAGNNDGSSATGPSTPDYVVKVLFGGGVGVLVGNVILTAAHCVNHGVVGPMAKDGAHVEEIETFQCRRLKTALLAVELVYDIAVLGSLDSEDWPKEANAFQQFCRATKPVSLAMSDVRSGQCLTVSIRNRDGTWVEGSVMVHRNDLPGYYFETKVVIENGASGGPVLNQRGELVGLVSTTHDENCHKLQGLWCPRPLRALPVWVCDTLLKEELDE
jgi:hypothetical protein